MEIGKFLNMAGAAYNFSGDDAQNYEDYLGPILFEPAAKELIKFLNPKSKSVLEIACGSGRVTRQLQIFFEHSTKITATDLSNDMLKVARRNIDNGSVEFLMADGQELPFDDERFDLVICQFGIMFFPDKEKGIKEAFRVLKKGGAYLFTTWDSTTSMPLSNTILEKTVIPFLQADNPNKYRTPYLLSDISMLEELMRSGGFHNVKAEHIEYAGKSENIENILNAFIVRHPLGREIENKEAGAMKRLADDLRSELKKQFGDKPAFTLKSFVIKGEK